MEGVKKRVRDIEHCWMQERNNLCISGCSKSDSQSHTLTSNSFTYSTVIAIIIIKIIIITTTITVAAAKKDILPTPRAVTFSS